MNALNNFEVPVSAMYDINALWQNNLTTIANANALFCQIMLMPMHCFYKLANANANANAPAQF